jgi:hypothetical protein
MRIFEKHMLQSSAAATFAPDVTPQASHTGNVVCDEEMIMKTLNESGISTNFQ